MTTVEHERPATIRSAIRAGMTRWYALGGGIAAWTIHLLFFAGFVRFTCTAPGHLWAMHAVTALCLAMTAVAIVLAVRLVRPGADEAADDEPGRADFLGRLAVIVGIANFLLISIEEIYVFVLHARRCG